MRYGSKSNLDFCTPYLCRPGTQAPETFDYRRNQGNQFDSNAPVAKLDDGLHHMKPVDVGNIKNRQIVTSDGQCSILTQHFRSPTNISMLQNWLEKRGLGHPEPGSLRPFMDQVKIRHIAEFPQDTIRTRADMEHHLKWLNTELLKTIVPLMETEKWAYVQYRRDWEGLRPIDYPVATESSTRNTSIVTDGYFFGYNANSRPADNPSVRGQWNLV